MKSVDESRFSDACLSGDKDELSLATQGAGETGAKSLADSANVLLYDFRIHIRLGPEGLKNLILRDETFRVFHEITEYVKSPGSEADALFRTPKTVVHGVEPEWLENLHCRTIAFR